MIPLLAILGGIGFSFDSAYAAVLDVNNESGCETGIPGAVFSVDQGLNVCTIPEGVDATLFGTIFDVVKIGSNGWLVVDGNLNILASGSMLQIGGLLMNNGFIENNNPHFLILPDGTIANSGTIQNDNVIQILGSIANIGTFDNLGSLIIMDQPDAAGVFTNMSPEDGFPSGGQLVNHNNGLIRVGLTSEFNLQDGSNFEDLGTVQIGYDYAAAFAAGMGGPEYVYEDTIDADGDGHNSIASGGADCNDADDTTYPGAPETVIGLDQNCDGAFLIDADNDGFASIASGGADCNDADDTTYPGAPETVIGLDQNCDSVAFESNDVPQPPVQNNETELTPQLCEETEGETDRVQWTDDPILPGYAGTCIITGKYDGTDAPGEGLIVSQDVILLLRDAPGFLAEGAMMQVNGALVLENTKFANMGLLQVNGYLQIDEDSTFYHIENNQSISFNGERFEVTGAGELIIDPNASVLLEGELKNSGLIENAGTFDINMCSGSIDNIRAATITNVENGVVNEIACNEQQVNNNEIVCGEGTEFFGGECRPIPQRLNPTVDVPEVPAPEVQQTETTIDLIATVTDTYENGVTTLDIKFNKNYVNYEIDVTQGGDRLFKETSHAMGTTATYEIEGQGSTDNPIDVKITSLGIGLPGQEDKWTGPTGVITTVQVVPEFGTIAMMILVVAIVSVVAITSKSRLMTKI